MFWTFTGAWETLAVVCNGVFIGSWGTLVVACNEVVRPTVGLGYLVNICNGMELVSGTTSVKIVVVLEVVCASVVLTARQPHLSVHRK